MCFSPEADLIGGLVVSGAGVGALRSVRHRREMVLASLPVMFGAHQLLEAVAWWGLEGVFPAETGEIAKYAYVVIAFALPLAVPWAMMAIEPDPSRRRAIRPLAILGGVVTAVLLAEVMAGPLTVAECGNCLAYDAHLTSGTELAALYVLAVCAPPLLSSVRVLRVFGALNVAAVAVLAGVARYAFISLWCAWAAVASLVIVGHLRSEVRTPVADAETAR